MYHGTLKGDFSLVNGNFGSRFRVAVRGALAG
jgi:hypothetical protein